jgi:hypothetical protein
VGTKIGEVQLQIQVRLDHSHSSIHACSAGQTIGWPPRHLDPGCSKCAPGFDDSNNTSAYGKGRRNCPLSTPLPLHLRHLLLRHTSCLLLLPESIVTSLKMIFSYALPHPDTMVLTAMIENDMLQAGKRHGARHQSLPTALERDAPPRSQQFSSFAHVLQKGRAFRPSFVCVALATIC